MADINAAFVIEDGLAFDETQTGIFTGSVNPSASPGEAAPIGSLFIRTDGTLYIKTGAADTDWQFVLRQPDVTFDGLAPTTTKGDLIVRTATGNVRLAVGQDRYVLMADATTPEGVKWAPDQAVSVQLDTSEPTGFVDRAESQISFVPGTRTFSIAPVATEFQYYYKGTKIVKTTTNSVTIPDTTGTYYISYDASATLQSSTSFFNLEDSVPVAIIYWNSVQQKATLFGDERHGITMDWQTHEYLHITRGAQYGGGFTVSDFTLVGGGASNGDAQIAITGGTIFDEDIKIQVVSTATPAANFEQDLAVPAKIPAIYRSGVGGAWYRDTATSFPLKFGVARPVFNLNTGGTWTTPDSGNNNYVATWVVATNDISEPVMFILGQREDSSLEQALRGNTWDSLDLANLPFKEMRPLYRLIFEVRDAFSNSVKAALRDIQDNRTLSIIQVATPNIVDHGILDGLTDDDHPQYVHTSVARTITAQHSFAPTGAAAPFVLGANAQTQLVTGLNADLLDGQHASAFQPADSDLTALAATTTTGIYTITGVGTSTTRSITGGSNKISVTNGDGVSGNPTIDIVEANINFPVTSVFGRTGDVVATEGDYSLTSLSDVTIVSPSPGQTLQYDGSQWINSATPPGSGTVTSVSVVAPTEGFSVTGSPITSSGTFTFTLTNDLAAVESLAGQGLAVRTATDTWATRQLVAPAEGIAITNANGVSGNPTFSLLNDLAAVEAISGTGIAVRTAADTWTTREIVGTADQISVTGGTGVLGNPTVAIADNPVLPGTESVKIPGGTTAERPGAPVEGDLRVNLDTDNLEMFDGTQWVFFKSSLIMGEEAEPTGHVNRTQSTISFDDATRTFTIAPVSGFYVYYVKGVRVVKTTSDSIQLPNTSGAYFIQFDAAGNLSQATVPDFQNFAYTSYVYWDAINSKSTVVAEERHGITMDGATHSYLHRAFGTQLLSGFDAGNFTTTGTGNSNSDATFSLTNGIISDEDIRSTITHSATPTNFFEQVLTPAVQMKILRKSGTGGVWVSGNLTNYPVELVTNRVGFNDLNGGNWTVTEATEGNYVAAWVFATNDVRVPVVSFMGQRQDATLDDAKNNNTVASLIFTGFPETEFKLLYRLIYQTSSAYTNDIKARLVNLDDYRSVKVSNVAFTSVTDHGELSGLGDDDHPQYVHVSENRTISATHTFNPSTANAPFILGSNAQGELVTGLNADLLDGLDATAFQPVDSTLTSLASFNSNGILVQTAPDTFTSRTITGTANQITVTNGDGVAGNPVIALADNPILAGTAGMVLNTGTSAERPATPTNGTIRYNTTLAATEIYQNGAWYEIGLTSPGGSGYLAIYTGTIPASSGTSATPWDNTSPLVTEGTEIWTRTITPSSTASTFKFTVPFTVDVSTSNRIVIASLFRGTVNIGSAVFFATGGGRPTTLCLAVSDNPATSAPVTYSMRVGIGGGGGTWYVNATNAGNDLGGSLLSSYEITEIG